MDIRDPAPLGYYWDGDVIRKDTGAVEVHIVYKMSRGDYEELFDYHAWGDDDDPGDVYVTDFIDAVMDAHSPHRVDAFLPDGTRVNPLDHGYNIIREEV